MSCDDYCNNHGCNRGPSCPAGPVCYGMPGCDDQDCPGYPGAAKVEKIGISMHDAKPLPDDEWGDTLKDVALAALFIVTAMCLGVLASSALWGLS